MKGLWGFGLSLLCFTTVTLVKSNYKEFLASYIFKVCVRAYIWCVCVVGSIHMPCTHTEVLTWLLIFCFLLRQDHSLAQNFVTWARMAGPGVFRDLYVSVYWFKRKWPSKGGSDSHGKGGLLVWIWPCLRKQVTVEVGFEIHTCQSHIQ